MQQPTSIIYVTEHPNRNERHYRHCEDWIAPMDDGFVLPRIGECPMCFKDCTIHLEPARPREQ